ncbi:MAG: class I adenylate-forming enzyme family protein [Hyphomonadaceae bacterium]
MVNSQSNPLLEILAGMPEGASRLEDYLAHWARVTPHEVATISEAGRLTYAGLAEHVALAAANLKHDGVIAGDIVAVLAPPSNDFLVSFLASVTLGAVWLGLNPKYTLREIEQVVSDAKPRLLLIRTRVGARDFRLDSAALGEMAARMRTDFRWLELQADRRVSSYFTQTQGTSSPAVERAEEARSGIAALVYTSGSTGLPKGAMLSHRALIRAALVRSTLWRVTPLRLINNVPINHVGGLGDLACTALVAGGSQVFLEAFSAEGTLAAMDRNRVTYWYQAPTMFEMCLSRPEAREVDWSPLQAAIWSGGRASASLVERMRAVARYVAVDYSMTESVGPIAMSPLSSLGSDLTDIVGWPEPGRQFTLLSSDIDATRGDVMCGEVLLNDQWMFDGYRADGCFRNKDEWFCTGDLVETGSDGSWRIAGRTKDMFKSGGYNVYPREVEMILERHTAVETAIVVPAQDPLYLEIGIAFVRLRSEATVAELNEHCRSLLANYKIPKRIHFLPEIPMLAIGKADRVRLMAIANGMLEG